MVEANMWVVVNSVECAKVEVKIDDAFPAGIQDVGAD
jgi:hypothetical protein